MLADSGIWVEDTGGDGTPVLLVHGDWNPSDIWVPLVGLLRDRYRVIRYDLRGFGRSRRPAAPFTRLGDLLAILDERGVGEAIAVGHSGGGGTALSLALAAPQRVRALLLVAPGVPDYPWPREDPYLLRAGALLRTGDRDELLELGLATLAAGGAGEEIRTQFREAIASWSAIGDLEQTDPPAFGRLAEIAAPTVVAIGDLEYPMIADAGRAIAARIRGCRTVTVPGADHLLPLRSPAVLARIVAELSRGPDAAGPAA